MAGFFNTDDDDFDLVDGKEDRAGAPSAPAPSAPPRLPAPQRPAPAQRPAAPRIPPRAPSLPPKVQPAAPATPAVRPARPAQPPRAATPAQPAAPQRTASPRVPAAPPRPAPKSQPEPEVEEYQEPYVEEPYEEEYDEVETPSYEPEPEPYRAPVRRRAEPEYSEEAEDLFAPATKATAPAPERVSAVAAKEKKPATGWGAILGLGGNKNAKPKAPASSEKSRSRWSGRRGPLIIRIVLVFLALIVGYNGVMRMFGPSEGPTFDQVQSAARDAVGVTGFPTEQGGSTAVGFAKVFFTYSSTETARGLRDAQLLQYVNASSSSSVDAIYPTEGSQSIINGPYLVSVESSDDSHAVATVSMTLQGASEEGSTKVTAKVVFVSIPLTYAKATNTMAIAGSPTFVPPTNVGGVDDAYSDPDWERDTDVASSIDESLLPQFFTAWAQSSTANLKSLLAGTKDTTLRAKSGLHGAVAYVPDSVTGTIVESAATGESTANRRRFQSTITWENGVSKAQYAQTYRGWIVRQPSGSWTMEDVSNAADFLSDDAAAK